MSLGKLLFREKTNAAVKTNTTFNAPGNFPIPYGKTVVNVGGRGASGNTTTYPYASTNPTTYPYVSTNPSAPGNAYYNYVAGNDVYTTSPGNAIYNTTPGTANYNYVAASYPYASTNPTTYPYAGTNATMYAGGSSVDTEYLNPGAPPNIYGAAGPNWGPAASVPSPTNNTAGASNGPVYRTIYTYYNVNSTTPGGPTYNTVAGTANYNYVAASYPYASTNPTTYPYAGSNPTTYPYSYTNPASYPYAGTNPATPGNANYSTSPGNANYNYIPGNSGSTVNIGGVTFPGGASDSLAPVVPDTATILQYSVSGFTVTVPPGGYVTIQNV